LRYAFLMAGHLIGYGRVSTHEQSPDSQEDALRSVGCDRVFIDRGVSGKLARRPELDACLEYMRSGDTLVITRLSRAARSLRHLLELADSLRERGIGLKVLSQDIDTTNATGRFLFHILAAVDELQREIIVEATLEGLAAARARGKKGGRVAKLSERQVARARELYDAKIMTVAEIGQQFGVSRQTIYRALEAR
jgi:DNA invertase Pin-like site-specific DNA recombinase